MAIAEGLIRRRLGLYLKILARVDNIDDELSAVLSRAGVRFTDLGLETHSEEIPRFYRKRTNVDQIRQAVLEPEQIDFDKYVDGKTPSPRELAVWKAESESIDLLSKSKLPDARHTNALSVPQFFLCMA